MKNMFWLGLFAIVGMSVAGVAQAASDYPVIRVAGDATPAPSVSAVGVVQQVSPEDGKVKISHEKIPALGWPAMTMVFRVKDKAVLAGIAAGDKVHFELGKDALGLVITRMVKADK